MKRRDLILGATLGAATAAVAVTVLVAISRGGSAIVEHGPRDRPWVALTFDADMTEEMLARLQTGEVPSGYDNGVVGELRAQRAAATIFLTGLWAFAYPDVVRSLADDALFELENHSMDHSAFMEPCFGLPAVASEEAKRLQVTEAADAILAVAGVAPTYFRFPGGCYEESDLDLVRELGHEPVQWDVVSGDSYERDPKTVAANVLREARPGSIVVMHLNGAPNAPATARALRILIPELRRRGFRLVTLRELLAPRP